MTIRGMFRPHRRNSQRNLNRKVENNGQKNARTNTAKRLLS